MSIDIITICVTFVVVAALVCHTVALVAGGKRTGAELLGSTCWIKGPEGLGKYLVIAVTRAGAIAVRRCD